MIRNVLLANVLFTLVVSYAWAAAPATSSADNTANQLLNTVAKLDADFFAAFNRCSSPDELERHASYLNANVEFYHDKGVASLGPEKTTSIKPARMYAAISGVY